MPAVVIKMEVKSQQIQTEIVKTVEHNVQAGSTAKQQDVYQCVDAAYQCDWGFCMCL